MTTTIRTEEVVRDDGRTLRVTRKCDWCSEDVSMDVEPQHFAQFVAGDGYIQTIFPYLTAGERELLLNGFCGPCFDAICPPDED